MIDEVTTKSFEETQELGILLAKELQGGDVVTLSGDLGSGKTTLTQGIAKGLGIKKRISSPTFIIMRTYKLPEKNLTGASFFYHVDLYRVATENDIEGLGLLELLGNKDAIVVIEWPEKITYLPKRHLDIQCSYIDDATRRFSITKSY
ncbi:MAG: tRNA (adenosine(37)-N6)-threonylcarbamoyltransferase complex ATPase subunit type 1 TsaE [Candidatus Levyibacteriota bacterium]